MHLSMPKRPASDLDTTFFLDPIDTDVPSARVATLAPSIIRQLFIQAARHARDQRHDLSPIVVKQMLRSAAHVEAQRSGSPITCDRFPPPLLSPPDSPEPSPILVDNPRDDDALASFFTLMHCTGCPGCNLAPDGCWDRLTPEQKQQRRIDEQRQHDE